MAVEVVEQHKSRPGTHDFENPKLDILYLVTGTDDELVMDAAVDANAPSTWGDLNRQGWDWTQPENPQMWYVTVHYDGRDQKRIGVQAVTMDNSGGTQHITVSKFTVDSAVPILAGGSAPKHRGSIGVTDTGIDGVDIPFSKTELTIEVLELATNLEETYVSDADKMVGTTNVSEVSFSFHGQEYEFDIGEMLMTSFQNQYRGNGAYAFTFKFLIIRNVDVLTIGNAPDEEANIQFTGGKIGHDYLWVQFKEGGGGVGGRTREPKAAYIEQVYDEAEFNDILFDRGWF